ncbi:MAG: hypothetical protein U5J82_06495 [Desulfobacterales bacterium]|nr:hypothetical protein [Desulfobacterales bacterium]
MTTLPTGGFSTRNASIAAYGSVYIDGVILLFMLLAGINSALHFQLLKENTLASGVIRSGRFCCRIVSDPPGHRQHPWRCVCRRWVSPAVCGFPGDIHPHHHRVRHRRL